MWNAGGKLPIFEQKQTPKGVKFQEVPALYHVEAELPRSTSVFKFAQGWKNLNPPSPREKALRRIAALGNHRLPQCS